MVAGTSRIQQDLNYAYAGSGDLLKQGDLNLVYSRDRGPLGITSTDGSKAWTFDEGGRLSSSPTVAGMGWGGENRLMCVKTPAGGRIRYAYQPNGDRFSQVTEGSSGDESIVYINKYSLYRKETGTLEKSYFFADARLARKVGDNPREHVAADYLNSARLTMREDGSVASHREFSPYGAVLENKTTGVGQELRDGFTGAMFDREASINQMGQRYYDGQLGGFASADLYFIQHPEKTLGSPIEAGLYTYGRNNPLKFTDPTGMYVDGNGSEFAGPASPDPSDGQFNSTALWSQSQGLDGRFEGLAGVNGDFARSGTAGRDLVTDVAFDSALTLGAGAIACAVKSLAGAALSSLESTVESQATRVFWSGGELAKNAAQNFAKSINGVTLEMTAPGAAVEQATKNIPWSEARPLWAQASRDFAEGATGEVHVFQNARGVSTTSIWREVEFPFLQSSSKVDNIFYHIVGQ